MMTKKYGRLTFAERIEIEKLLSHHESYTVIAMALGRSKSTIAREVNKQEGRDRYKAMEAERMAVSSVSNRRSGKNKIKQNAALEKYLGEKPGLRWSPWQIHKSLQHTFPENKAMQIPLSVGVPPTETYLKQLLVGETPASRKTALAWFTQQVSYIFTRFHLSPFFTLIYYFSRNSYGIHGFLIKVLIQPSSLKASGGYRQKHPALLLCY